MTKYIVSLYTAPVIALRGCIENVLLSALYIVCLFDVRHIDETLSGANRIQRKQRSIF